jgi:formylglycine-generating enzyme required for sulfatase activity
MLSAFNADLRLAPPSIDPWSVAGLIAALGSVFVSVRLERNLSLAVLFALVSFSWVAVQYSGSLQRYLFVDALDRLSIYAKSSAPARHLGVAARLLRRLFMLGRGRLRSWLLRAGVGLAPALLAYGALLVGPNTQRRLGRIDDYARFPEIPRIVALSGGLACSTFAALCLALAASNWLLRRAGASRRARRRTLVLNLLGMLTLIGVMLLPTLASAAWVHHYYDYPFTLVLSSQLWHAFALVTGSINPYNLLWGGQLSGALVAGVLGSMLAASPLVVSLIASCVSVLSPRLQAAMFAPAERLAGALAADPRGALAKPYYVLAFGALLLILVPERAPVLPQFAGPVPAGRYWIGAMNDRELERGLEVMPIMKGNDGSERAHQFLVPRAYVLTKTEVTQSQWRAVLAMDRSLTAKFGLPTAPWTYIDDDYPVETITFCEALRFVNLWSMAERKKPVYFGQNDFHVVMAPPSSGSRRAADENDYMLPYCGDTGIGVDLDADGYRLPLEEEWEIVARYDALHPQEDEGEAHAISDPPMTVELSGLRPHKVAETRGNPLGVFDMYGGVGEWVSHTFPWEYHMHRSGVVLGDLVNAFQGHGAQIRGGDWARARRHSGPEIRGFGYSQRARSSLIGFRVFATKSPSACAAPPTDCVAFDAKTCRCRACAKVLTDVAIVNDSLPWSCANMKPEAHVEVYFQGAVELATLAHVPVFASGHATLLEQLRELEPRRAARQWREDPIEETESIFDAALALANWHCEPLEFANSTPDVSEQRAKRLCRILASAERTHAPFASYRELREWAAQPMGDPTLVDFSMDLVVADQRALLAGPAPSRHELVSKQPPDLLAKVPDSGDLKVEFQMSRCAYAGQPCEAVFKHGSGGIAAIVALEVAEDVPPGLQDKQQSQLSNIGLQSLLGLYRPN